MSIKDKYPFNHIKNKLNPPKTVYAGPDYFEKNAAGVYSGPEYFSAPVAPPAEEYPAPTYAGPEMNGGIGAFAPMPEEKKEAAPAKNPDGVFCTMCGAINPENANFCSKCGAPLVNRG